MKITETIKEVQAFPKWAGELAMFLGFSLLGAIYKMLRQNQKGVKITFKKMAAEAFMSVFIAGIVYSVFDQFLHFNKLFTFCMCSLCGSMSTVITDKVEGSIDWGFEAAKKATNKYLNL